MEDGEGMEDGSGVKTLKKEIKSSVERRRMRLQTERDAIPENLVGFIEGALDLAEEYTKKLVVL